MLSSNGHVGDEAELGDPNERVGYLLWQTAHVVSRRMIDVLATFDLTSAQFGALVHVAREPGVSAAELARRLNLSPQSVQTALRPLMERDWMRRHPHPVNQRVLGNFLTAEGSTRIDQASAAVATSDQELVADLTPEETAALKDHLHRILLAVNPTALDRSSIRAAYPSPPVSD